MASRATVAILPFLALLAACAVEEPMSTTESDSTFVMYVGTYTRETSAGIYGYRFDAASGEAESLGLLADLRDPSFLALHPTGKYLYAVTESDDFDSEGSGSVSSFAVDPDSGGLDKMNEVSSRGGWPCHLSVDGSGRMLIVANYKGGSVASFPVNEDGTLGSASSFYQHEGSSVHSRQEQPHAHSADFSADGEYAFFSDLGLDRVMVYKADASTATIAPHDPPHVEVEPGSGPRHFAQHPSGRFAYGLNELSSTVSVFGFDAEAGVLSVIQTVSTLPEDFEGENYTAEIYVHPSGKFVYASNRGHHSIAVFTVDGESGMLEPAGQVSTRGEWPRNFAFDPTGRYLLAANQNSDNIAVFRIDPVSGALESSGVDLAMDAPVCIVFGTRPS